MIFKNPRRALTIIAEKILDNGGGLARILPVALEKKVKKNDFIACNRISFLTSLGYGKNHRERDEGAEHKQVRPMRNHLRGCLARVLGRLQKVEQAS